MKNPRTASRLVAASAAMAGDLARAGTYRRSFLQSHPNARLEDIKAFMPHKNGADVEHYIAALRCAGFS
jgi:hypothetical protein